MDLDYSDRLVGIIDEGFDVVRRTGDAVDSGLMMKRLGGFSLVIVGSPDYLDAHGTLREPEDLSACLLTPSLDGQRQVGKLALDA